MILTANGSTVTGRYIRALNLVAADIGGTRVWYLFNARGDVVQLTNSNGVVTRTYTYDAFGNELDYDENDPNPFRFAGEYWDRETGTYYLRARPV